MSFGPILDAALAAQAAYESIGSRGCVIGGVALQRWGEPRFTADADLRTCSVEDLVVMKAFAGRDKDWADVTSILERQGQRLDLTLVREELKPLLVAKEAPELGHELERRIARHLPNRDEGDE